MAHHTAPPDSSPLVTSAVTSASMAGSDTPASGRGSDENSPLILVGRVVRVHGLRLNEGMEVGGDPDSRRKEVKLISVQSSAELEMVRP